MAIDGAYDEEEAYDEEAAALALRTARQVNAFLNAEAAALTARVEKQAAELDQLREKVKRLSSGQAAGPSSPNGEPPPDERFERLRAAAAASGCLALDPEGEIVLGAKLGEGSSGETWRGLWRGADAAIKMVRVDTPSRVVCFLREVEVLSKLRHPNILPFLCASLVRPSHCWIIAEHMAGGTLKSWLYKDGVSQRTPQQRLRAAQDIANGLEYLHSNSPSIIHRDLKPSNVFLDHCERFRIADFGLARFVASDGDGVMTGETGTYLYMAPEVIRHEAYDLAADVYSFGVLLAELLSGHRPYAEDPHLKAAQIAMAVAAGKLSPTIPVDTPEELRTLATECCLHDATKRPPISKAATVIRKEVSMPTKQISSGFMKYIWS